MKYILDLYIYLVLNCIEFSLVGLDRSNIFFCILAVVCFVLFQFEVRVFQLCVLIC